MDFFNTAAHWHKQGVSCLPCQPGTKFLLKGVSPKHFLSNPPDLGQYYKWFIERNCNLAVLTGNGLVVLDFDDMDKYRGWRGVESYTVKTRRGAHVYIRATEEVNHTSPLCEVKYNAPVVAPPSIVGEYEYRVICDAPIMRIDKLDDILPSKRKATQTPGPAVNVTINGDNNRVSVHVSPLTRQYSPIAQIKASFPITHLFPNFHLTNDNGMALAHCPTAAHERGDIHPSLSLDLRTNRFNCFKPGCPLHLPHGGDVIDGYAILHELTLRQAIAQLAAQGGLEGEI